jgi:hypothetical protein
VKSKVGGLYSDKQAEEEPHQRGSRGSINDKQLFDPNTDDALQYSASLRVDGGYDDFGHGRQQESKTREKRYCF